MGRLKITGLVLAIVSVITLNYGTGEAHADQSYVRYDHRADRADTGYPKKVDNGTWPGLFQWGTSAAVNWGNGKAYFFSGDAYIRYDIRSDRTDAGYPKKIDNGTWPGLFNSGIDAAVNWGNGKAYFFSGDAYIRYDIRADRADPGYPKRVDHGTWPGLPALGPIISAVNWGNGKAYFFGERHYIRYDIATDRADPGYPKPINAETWPGIFAAGNDAVVNWGNGKSYFFAR